jgi:NAD(P)-dependent dehydrogenase (short-subunit alcohol dehydrogenase family)
MERDMSGRLQGKTALITGAASGIGRATLELFVAQGCRVIAADIQDAKGQALEDRHPEAVRHVRCDVTDEAQIAAAVAAAVAAFGGLDILINNAGVSDMTQDITRAEAAVWDRTFALLLRAPMLGIKHAAPHMAARGGGAVINIASVAGLQAGFGPLAYSSAKAGLLQLTRSAAAELGGRGIRVNAILPGLIATSIFGASAGLSPEVAEKMAAKVEALGPQAQPIAKPGLPEDVARAALYLAGEEAAFVTGAQLVVDGGLSVGPRHAWDPETPSPLATIFAR